MPKIPTINAIDSYLSPIVIRHEHGSVVGCIGKAVGFESVHGRNLSVRRCRRATSSNR
ncbi:MAG: hypothetical protein Q4D56_09095 [Bacteroides sp.]|nr:hypothetical protein [Bacteroides sp.]